MRAQISAYPPAARTTSSTTSGADAAHRRSPTAAAANPMQDWWKCRDLFQEQKLYQQTVQSALHPLSRCHRVLVDARAGSGKTRTITSH